MTWGIYFLILSIWSSKCFLFIDKHLPPRSGTFYAMIILNFFSVHWHESLLSSRLRSCPFMMSCGSHMAHLYIFIGQSLSGAKCSNFSTLYSSYDIVSFLLLVLLARLSLEYSYLAY